MLKIDFRQQTLSNGLRFATINLPGFNTITNFLVIRSGSRYESKHNNGVAHFLEHMVFKGTKTYPTTLEIARAIEGIGGYFNAWTSVDHTSYWNIVPYQHWEIGALMPLELAFYPRLRQEDLERERGVILEEVKMIQDDPARLVDDLLMRAAFGDHPLGQFIIGTPSSIKKLSLADFQNYHRQYYHSGQAMFLAIGKVGRIAESLRKFVQDKMAPVAGRAEISRPKIFRDSKNRGLLVKRKQTDQTHFMLGSTWKGFALSAAERFVGAVLNSVLGRGMSSRLFLRIREEQGLAYAIRSEINSFEDTGMISIYGGVNTDKVERALESVLIELRRLQEEPVGKVELEKAKAHLIGSLTLNTDRPIELAKWYGTDRLLGAKESFAEAIELVNSVTPAQIQDLARKIFLPKRLNMAVIGPYESDEIFRAHLI